MSISSRWPRPLHRAARYAALAAGVAAVITTAAACGVQASRVSPMPHMSTAMPHTSTAMPSSARQMGRNDYLYAWAGTVGRRQHDRLLTFDFNPLSRGYGKLVADTIIPGPGGVNNEPHHCGMSANGQVLACGGLLGSLHNHSWLFFFGLKNPAHPVLLSSQKTPLAAFPDAFVPLPDNGFLVTEMGSLDGGAPGRVAEFNGADKLVGLYPADPPSAFNPHGIDVRPDLNVMVTCDYVEPASTLNAVPGPVVLRSSVRVWNYRRRSIEKTIELPAGAGSMDCLLLPHDSYGEGYVGGSGNGQLYLFDSRAGTEQDVFDFNTIAPGALTEVMAVSSDGSRLFVPYTTGNGRVGGIAMFDITDPDHPWLLDNFNLGPGSGPHMAMLADNDSKLIVSDYFLNEGNFGKVHLDGDHHIRVFDVGAYGLTADPRFQVDLNTLIPGVQLRPHGIAVNGMSMGAHD